MTNGIGPSSQVRSNMAYTAFYNAFSSLEEAEDGSREKVKVKKEGTIVFATANNLQLFGNMYKKPASTFEEMAPRDLPMDDFNPMSVDFAPFLSRPYSEKINTKDPK